MTDITAHALHEPLRAFLRKRVHETAEDLRQDTFLRIHTHADTLREEKKLDRPDRPVSRDRLRPTAKARGLPGSGQRGHGAEEMPEDDVQAELASAVAAMVNALPEPSREAIDQTDNQGLAQRELVTLVLRRKIAGSAGMGEA